MSRLRWVDAADGVAEGLPTISRKLGEGEGEGDAQAACTRRGQFLAGNV